MIFLLDSYIHLVLRYYASLIQKYALIVHPDIYIWNKSTPKKIAAKTSYETYRRLQQVCLQRYS